MRFIIGTIAAGLLVGITTAAHAQTNGFYVGAEGGLNILRDADYTGNPAPRGVVGPGINGKIESDNGWGLLGQAGYGFGQVRLEGEVGYRRNSIDKASMNRAPGTLATDNKTEALDLMANVYYDIPTGTPFVPFLGAGLGGARVKMDLAGLGKDSSTVWAAQGIAGLAYNINQNLALKADYRYFTTKDPKFDIGGSRIESEYQNHSVFVGFTYKFGESPAPVQVAAPTPPPPPAATTAPAPAPAPAPKGRPKKDMV
ncbi:MAG: porin family protein, partial [Rhodospirillales bacterium]|nr:porin family protein [Rhodospirillales bacterium]